MTDLFKAAENNRYKINPGAAFQNLPTTAGGLQNSTKTVRALATDSHDLLSILAVPFNPITGLGSLPITTLQGDTNNINFISSLLQSYNLNGTSALPVAAEDFFFNSTLAQFAVQEEASLISSVVATTASSTQLVAAGGAGKKYKLFAASIAASSIGAATQVNATINEVTSGAILLGLNISGSAATGENNAVSIQFGPNGCLQTTANNAIQITAPASVSAYATLVYGAAR